MFSFLSASLAGSAQISLSQTDLASPGTVVIDQGTAYTLGVPTKGANQMWDFMAVGDSIWADTTTYVLPSSTPYAAVMPGSNLAANSGGSYTYFEKSSSGFYLRGIVFQIPPLPLNLPFTEVPFNFTPKIPIIKFPGNYGQINSGTGEGNFVFDYDTTVTVSGVDIHITQAKIIATLTLKDTVDGWGDALFTSQSVSSLRQSQSQVMTFKIQGYTVIPIIGGTWVNIPVPGGLPTIKSSSILFWANGKNAPIASIGLDTTGNVTDASFQQPLLVTKNRSLVQSSELETYPNPAQNVLYWNENTPLKNIKLFSSEGRILLNQKVNKGERKISLEKFPDGLYSVSAETEKGETFWKKLIINK